ncbi:MAG: CRISPR-associated protein, partial [Anaerolineae bacterium]|nr:CRISPR-associated protein [Anaerolineae bacterium]
MAWVHYTLRFRLLSPLHIGYRKVGNLMQTRSYVPGKVLWGALTARLTRDLGQGADGRAYQNIGKQVQDHFRFGYLWPSLDGQRLYLPWEQDDFDYLLLGSYASTALDYDRQAAEEGSLHETEFIAPVARDGRPVYLLGDLWVRDNLPPELENWRKALGRVQLGGERAYGWGRVRLESDLNAGSQSSTTVAGYSWEERADEVVICLLQGARACAHVLAAGSDAVREMVGPVEVLVGWEMNPAGGFQISQQPLVC